MKRKLTAMLNRKTKPKKGMLAAFTLTELLVVLVIIGILVLIAVPSLTGEVNNARAVEAKLQLEHLYQKQETYHMVNLRYASSLEELGFKAPKLKEEGGDAWYTYQIVSADDRTFRAQATAFKDFDDNGSVNKWEINQEKSLTEINPE